jgi:hypothetical protein
MPDDPIQGKAERAAVLELADRYSRGHARTELHKALSADFTAKQVDAAVASLVDAGVLRATPNKVYGSAALQRLDELGFIDVANA